MTPLQTAEARIRSTLGLSDTPSDWTYDQRIAYVNSLRTWVNANPAQVSPAELAVAQGEMNSTALDDTSFLTELSAFGGEVGNNVLNAGEKVAGIGTGILDFAGMLKWLIPVAGLTLVGIVLYKFYKK